MALIASASIDSASGQSIAWQRSAYGAADASGRPGCDRAPTSAFVHGVDASGNLFVASCHRGLIRTAKLAAATGVELWSRTHLPSNLPPSSGTPIEAFGVPSALAVDGAGNVVVTGYTVNALGWHNVRTIKYDGANGTEIWNVTEDAGVNSEASAVALDPSGNVVVTGYRRDRFQDEFRTTMKYNGATGAVMWSAPLSPAYSGRSAGAPVIGGTNAVALDAAANVIVTGSSIELGGSVSIRTIKYNGRTGAEIWNVASAASGGDFASGRAVALDAAGNAVVTGYSKDAVGYNIRTIKYSAATGAELWNVSYGAGEAYGNAVAVDASGNVVITGSTYLGFSGYDIRTIKYNGATGAVLWNASYAGTSGSENKGHAVALDVSGNVVVTGYGRDPTYYSAIRTIKYNGATGAELWNVMYDGPPSANDRAHAVALDPFGDVLVTGYSASGGTNRMQARSIKYSGATGAMLWTAADAPVPAAARPAAMVVDPSGNPVVTGYANRNDFAGQLPEVRTIKYDAASGAELWSMTFNAPAGGGAKGNAIAVDAVGDVAVTGYSGGDTGIDEGIRTVKYRGTTGAVIWSAVYRSAGGLGAAGTAVAIDNTGSVVVTGYSNDSSGFSTNIRSIKYHGATGAELWNVAFSGSGNGDDQGNAVAVDSSGNILVTGKSADTVGGTNIRTIKYSGATGAELWNVSYNGAANGPDVAYAIALDASGNVFVTGHSSESTAAVLVRTIKYHGGTGAVLWTASYDGTSGGGGNSYAIALDASGNVAVAGHSRDSAGGLNLLTTKLNGATGARIWIGSFTGEGFFDYTLPGNPPVNASWDSGRAIAFDPSGQVIVAGWSADASGGFNSRTIKYDGATGAQIWSQPYDGSRRGADEAIALALGPGGSIFVTGVSTEIGKPQSWYVQKLETPPVSPTALDFGGQSMGTTSARRTVTLTNTGGATLTISAVSVSNSQFAQTNDCTSVAPSATCTITLTFSPASVAGALNSTAAVSGTLTITSNSTGGTISVSLSGTAEKSLVTHYYRSILRRAPDAGGKAYWEAEAARVQALGVNVNEVWFAMAGSFYSSVEYLALNRDNSAYVTDLYNTFFNRAPDSGGFSSWTGLLAAGMPREVVLASFMFSSEFSAFTQAIFGSPTTRKEIDTVVDFYRGILGRLPDQAGFNYWLSQFRAAQCQGASSVTSQAELISSLYATSQEYVTRGRSSAQYVGDMYNAFLRRGGDLAGVQYWIGQIDTGARTRENVRQQFVGSPEFSARVAAVIAQGCLQ